MCVAVYKPAGVKTPSLEILKKCWDCNPHGAGFAMREQSGIHIVKGFMTWEDFVRAFQQYQLESFDNDLFLHFRLASKGGIVPENTHPFPLSPVEEELRKLDCRTDYALVHNGGFPVVPVFPDSSDTAELCRRLGEGNLLRKIPECLALLKDMINSSRVAVMTPDQVHLAGEWHTRDQVLFSNLWWDLKDLNALGKITRCDAGILHEFTWDDCPCQIMEPKKPRPGKPWLWKTEKISSSAFEREMLDRGFYIAFMQIPQEYGSPRSMKHWDSFYAELTLKYDFGRWPILYGIGPGGLMVYSWGAANSKTISCIYSENPVCDFKSWPGGKGNVPPSTEDWQNLLRAYEFSNETEALNWPYNPVDNLAPLIRAGVPLIHSIDDHHAEFPVDENTGLLEKNYLAAVCKMQVFRHTGKSPADDSDGLQTICNAVENTLLPKKK